MKKFKKVAKNRGVIALVAFIGGIAFDIAMEMQSREENR